MGTGTGEDQKQSTSSSSSCPAQMVMQPFAGALLQLSDILRMRLRRQRTLTPTTATTWSTKSGELRSTWQEVGCTRDAIVPSVVLLVLATLHAISRRLKVSRALFSRRWGSCAVSQKQARLG